MRKQMGEAGRNIYQKNFTFRQMLDATLGIYDQVIEGRR